MANGHQEPILQAGDLGPLKGVQKVNNFHRVLVSVMQLCKQFGPVVFSSREVLIGTKVGGRMIGTVIGLPTPGNLFSFDLEALKEHAAKVKVAELAEGHVRAASPRGRATNRTSRKARGTRRDTRRGKGK